MAIIKKLNLAAAGLQGYRPALTDSNAGLIIAGNVVDPVTLLPTNKNVENSNVNTSATSSAPAGALSRGWAKRPNAYGDNFNYRVNIGNQVFPNFSVSGLMESAYDVDTNYFVVEAVYGATNRLLKCRASDGLEVLLSATSVGGGTTQNNAVIVHEDANYVYFFTKDCSGTLRTLYGWRFDKVAGTSSALVWLTSYSAGTALNSVANVESWGMLHKDSTSMIFAYILSIGATSAIALSYIALPGMTWNAGSYFTSSGSMVGLTQARTTSGTIKELYSFSATTSNVYGQRLTFDTTNPATKSNTACTFDYTKAANGFIALPTAAATDEGVCFTEHLLVVNGVSYLIAVMTMPSMSSSTIPVANFNIYVYEIDGTTPTKLYFRYAHALSGKARAAIPFGDALDKILVVYDTSLEVWAFGGDAVGFQKQSTLTISPVSAGFDSQGRLWVIDTSSNLHMLTPTLTATVVLTWGAPSYSYTGSTIASTLAVSAYNFTGARIATNVQITLEGPNLSFSDGTAIKTVATSSSADVLSNIQITGPGYIKAYGNIVP